jgi:hypothetical protein
MIIFMSDLGIPDSVFLDLQDQWFTNKKAVSAISAGLKMWNTIELLFLLSKDNLIVSIIKYLLI